jgi:hypothetical protein
MKHSLLLALFGALSMLLVMITPTVNGQRLASTKEGAGVLVNTQSNTKSVVAVATVDNSNNDAVDAQHFGHHGWDTFEIVVAVIVAVTVIVAVGLIIYLIYNENQVRRSKKKASKV